MTYFHKHKIFILFCEIELHSLAYQFIFKGVVRAEMVKIIYFFFFF